METQLPEYYLTKFASEWSHLLPQLNRYLEDISEQRNVWKDVTEIFIGTKCRVLAESIRNGEKVSALLIEGGRGIIEKWETEKERPVRASGKLKIACNASVVSTAVIDVVAPFINTDEILQIKSKRIRPYNLEREKVFESFKKCRADPEVDTIFLFVTKPDKIRNTITMFLDGLTFILKGEFKESRGFLQVEAPRFKKYHDERIDNLVFQFYQRGVVIHLSNFAAQKRKWNGTGRIF